jgi:integrase
VPGVGPDLAEADWPEELGPRREAARRWRQLSRQGGACPPRGLEVLLLQWSFGLSFVMGFPKLGVNVGENLKAGWRTARVNADRVETKLRELAAAAACAGDVTKPRLRRFGQAPGAAAELKNLASLLPKFGLKLGQFILETRDFLALKVEVQTLAEDEIARLLKAAQERPLREALTIRRGKNTGKPLAKVGDHERRRLERLGQERALVYKFMMLTGLRHGEVASLTVNAICLDETNPYVQVEGKYAKSGRAATPPLRGDLADDLRKHVARLAGGGQTPPDARLFNLGRNFLRAFNLDLAAAGIAKRDAQGRTVDVHGMRHTFATLLARKGVTPSVAQKLMRHSDIRLTMNTYTHLDLTDTAGAVAALPAF